MTGRKAEADPSLCHPTDEDLSAGAPKAKDDNCLISNHLGGMAGGLVFPVALFAFGDPFDGLGDALVAGFRAFGIGDPLDVFALATGGEFLEDFGGGFAGFEGLGEFWRDFEGFLGGFDYLVAGGDGAGVLACIHEGDGLLEPGEELFVGGKVFEGGDAAEGAHAFFLDGSGGAEDGADFLSPEAEATVLFEGGDVAEDVAFVFEEGAGPFDGFDDVGAGFVDELAEVGDDGPGEGLGFVDVDVDARVEVVGHVGPRVFRGPV